MPLWVCMGHAFRVGVALCCIIQHVRERGTVRSHGVGALVVMRTAMHMCALQPCL